MQIFDTAALPAMWALSSREREWMQILSSYFFEWLIFTVHFVITVYLETRYCQSLTTGKMWIRELLRKRKWTLKVALAVVSDPAVCVSLSWRQVPLFTCWPKQNTWWRSNSLGATNRRLVGWMRPGGRLLRTTGIVHKNVHIRTRDGNLLAPHDLILILRSAIQF